MDRVTVWEMKRALLIGVADHHPEQVFRPEPSLAAMEKLLEDLGDWSLVRVDGPTASRQGILAALEDLEQAIEPNDDCLVYFIGHGGVVEIMDLPPPLGGRPVFYVCVARDGEEWSFQAILDVELSLRLARIDEVCGNVSAILDCCYSARTVRGPLWRLLESPAWVREVAAQTSGSDVDKLLCVTGHPRIVRLAASSSLRKTFAEVRADGHLGRLTRLFTEVVREAELRLDRLTWDALAHRIREQAIWRLGCEEQWVSLIGPRQRLVFSRREIELPRTVGFVPREEAAGGWIRAGALQGVRLGDEWGLAELTLDANDQPQVRGRCRVVGVDLNRAEVEPISGEGSAPPGASAMLLRAHDRTPVIVDGPSSARDAVTASAWLAPASAQTEAMGSLSVRGDAIETVASHAGYAPGCFPADEYGLQAAVDRLEDWARARLLSSVAASQTGTVDSPIEVSFGRYQDVDGRQLPRVLRTVRETPGLHVGDRMFVRVAHVGEHAQWFVSAVHIDVAGRPTLLDDSEPDGRELLDGETAIIGERPHRQVQGIELTWPEGVASEEPRTATIIVLASRRPIQLGHLVRGQSSELAIPRDVPRKTRARVRGHLSQPRPRTGPELASDWTTAVIRYQLDPRPRT